MKVSCPSCEAKYNIADDKVKGKKVKVRCKTCGTQILVDGTQPDPVGAHDAPAPGEQTISNAPVAAEPVTDAWTVNFSDTDERTLTTPELVEMALQGALSDDIFVWREGMDDWAVYSSVPAIAQAIAAAKGAATGVAQPASATAPHAEDVLPPANEAPGELKPGAIVAAPGSALAKKQALAKNAAATKTQAGARATQPEEDAPENAPEPAAGRKSLPDMAGKAGADTAQGPKAANKFASKKAGTAHDLFAAADARPGGDVDVDVPREDHDAVKATGARNENSVLFSLDALKSGMLGGTQPPAAAQTAAGPRKKPVAPTKRLEDLMTVDNAHGMGGARNMGGGLLLGGNDALLAAPPPPPKPEPKPEVAVAFAPGSVQPSAPPKKKLGLYLVGAIVLVAAGAGGAVFALKSGDKDKTEAVASASASNESAAPSAAPSAPVAKVDSPAANAGAAASATTDSAATASASTPAAAAPAATAKAGAVAAAVHAGNTGATTSGTKSTPEAKPAEKKETKPTAEPAPAAGAGPFNKEAAIAQLSVAASQATVCKRPEGPWGTGKAVITFAPSGRVTTANVAGDPFGGTPVGGCVANVFRRAKIPAFTGEPVTVSKGFTIAP